MKLELKLKPKTTALPAIYVRIHPRYHNTTTALPQLANSGALLLASFQRDIHRQPTFFNISSTMTIVVLSLIHGDHLSFKLLLQ